MNQIQRSNSFQISERKLDYESFAPKLGLWGPKFKPFIESSDMWEIMDKIRKDAFKERINENGDIVFIKGETIVPFSDNTFRTFKTTNPNNIRVIFILQDPYPRYYKGTKIPQADGIALSCENSPDGALQPSLNYFYDAIDKELEIKVERSNNLLYLHEQGIMMLNSDLTCKLNKTESHSGYWDKFQKYFLEEVMYETTGIIYVLCGKLSHRLEKYINPLGNYIFKLSHPSSAQYGMGYWESKNIFLKINKILKDNNNFNIYWNKKDWDEELPF